MTNNSARQQSTHKPHWEAPRLIRLSQAIRSGTDPFFAESTIAYGQEFFAPRTTPASS